MIQVQNRAGNVYLIDPVHLEKFQKRGFTVVTPQAETAPEQSDVAEATQTDIGE